jgi:biopolymer transport protein ExbB
MENPYGLAPLIQNGDAVSRSVLGVLLIMSLLTWYAIFTKLWYQYRMARSVSMGGLSSKPSTDPWLLATIGLTAPLVGVFGTIFGTLKALISFGLAGKSSIEELAGPVGQALLTTAIGLAVAVPAIIGYNLLMKRNRAIQN